MVCAEAQSKGRGRLGRAWTSPKAKGLYFSFVLRPSLPLNQLAQLTLMSAVALAEAIEGISDLKPSIKWPNDILLGRPQAGGYFDGVARGIRSGQICRRRHRP